VRVRTLCVPSRVRRALQLASLDDVEAQATVTFAATGVLGAVNPQHCATPRIAGVIETALQLDAVARHLFFDATLVARDGDAFFSRSMNSLYSALRGSSSLACVTWQ